MERDPARPVIDVVNNGRSAAQWQGILESWPPFPRAPDPSFKAQHGLERLGDWHAGRNVPPFACALDISLVDFGVGHVRFELPMSEWYRTHAGVVPSSVLAYLVDVPLGAAILSKAPPGKAITTSQLSTDFVRPVPIGTNTIGVDATLEHIGRSTATSTAWITADGRTVARASTRCVVRDAPTLAPRDVADSPQPLSPIHERVEGSVTLSDEEVSRRAGADISVAVIDGSLAPSPFQKLTGLRPVQAGNDGVVIEMPTLSWYRSGGPHLYGGALYMLMDNAAAVAVEHTLPAGTLHAPLDLVAHFVRPVLGNGRPLRAHASILHRGRSLAVAEVRVMNAEGDVVAFGRGSSALIKAPSSILRPS